MNVYPDSLEPNDEEIKHLNDATKNAQVKQEIVWSNVLKIALIHMGALIGLFLCFKARFLTLTFSIILVLCGGFGITAGAHRLWAHKSYKAKLPVRLLLGFFQTLAGQNDIYEWSRDHRVHHKYSETNADPHNIQRGFFFAHIGWLLVKKHPDVKEKGKRIYMNDLLEDPVVYWQRQFYMPLAIIICFILPAILPTLLWNESLLIGICIPMCLRYVITLHGTWSVNSFAHLYGSKPYDERINPVENLMVSLSALGEGFHNYHHTFPQDYATSEYGIMYFNPTKGLIDLCAWFGLVTDRHRTKGEQVLKRRVRTGDLQLNKKHDKEIISHASLT